MDETEEAATGNEDAGTGFTLRRTSAQRRWPPIAAGAFAAIAALLGIVALVAHDGAGGNVTVCSIATAVISIVLLLFDEQLAQIRASWQAATGSTAYAA